MDHNVVIMVIIIVSILYMCVGNRTGKLRNIAMFSQPRAKKHKTIILKLEIILKNPNTISMEKEWIHPRTTVLCYSVTSYYMESFTEYCIYRRYIT